LYFSLDRGWIKYYSTHRLEGMVIDRMYEALFYNINCFYGKEER